MSSRGTMVLVNWKATYPLSKSRSAWANGKTIQKIYTTAYYGDGVNHSYNFITSFEICHSWSNLHNLSCHIRSCSKFRQGIPSAKKWFQKFEKTEIMPIIQKLICWHKFYYSSFPHLLSVFYFISSACIYKQTSRPNYIRFRNTKRYKILKCKEI